MLFPDSVEGNSRMAAAVHTIDALTSQPAAIDVTVAAFYGVLGVEPAYATRSGIEALACCHAMNAYS